MVRCSAGQMAKRSSVQVVIRSGSQQVRWSGGQEFHVCSGDEELGVQIIRCQMLCYLLRCQVIKVMRW